MLPGRGFGERLPSLDPIQLLIHAMEIGVGLDFDGHVKLFFEARELVASFILNHMRYFWMQLDAHRF
jgi:hypothetical protein